MHLLSWVRDNVRLLSEFTKVNSGYSIFHQNTSHGENFVSDCHSFRHHLAGGHLEPYL